MLVTLRAFTAVQCRLTKDISSSRIRDSGGGGGDWNKILLQHFSSSAVGPSSLDIKGPSRPSHSWERSAKLVKNTDVTNKYLEHIRESHDPSMHIKSLEDEIRGTMGQALGKQGDKILRNLRCMKEEYDQYHALLSSSEQPRHSRSSEIVLERARKYNFYREQAKTARWELIVHRQAIGFIVNNHNFVSEKYPIGPALPVTKEEIEKFETTGGEVSNEKNQNFTGQLEWWQRVGRWR